MSETTKAQSEVAQTTKPECAVSVRTGRILESTKACKASGSVKRVRRVSTFFSPRKATNRKNKRSVRIRVEG